MKIVASSPGDIVVEFKVVETTGSGAKIYIVPVKSLSAQKTMDTSKEYGVGSHQAYAEVVGKIAYEGDFELGSWYVSDESNPETWAKMIELLTYQTDEGLPREFTINVHARSGAAMERVGTGTYGSSLGGYSGSTLEDSLGATVNNNTATTGSPGPDTTVILSYYRCILKGDSMSIPEVGGTVTTKYSFSSLYRNPK